MFKSNMTFPNKIMGFLLGLFTIVFALDACSDSAFSEEEFSKVEKEILEVIEKQFPKNGGIKLTTSSLTEFDIESADNIGELSDGTKYAIFSGVPAAMHGYFKVVGEDLDCSTSEDDIGINRTTRKFISCVLSVLNDCGEGTIHKELEEIHVHSACEEE